MEVLSCSSYVGGKYSPMHCFAHAHPIAGPISENASVAGQRRVRDKVVCLPPDQPDARRRGSGKRASRTREAVVPASANADAAVVVCIRLAFSPLSTTLIISMMVMIDKTK